MSGHIFRPSGGGDVIAYRSHAHALFASVRPMGGDWAGPFLTDIPNDDTNINAGVLPDGRVRAVAVRCVMCDVCCMLCDACSVRCALCGVLCAV